MQVKLVVLKLSERLGALATPSPSGRVGSLAKAPVSQAAGVSHSALFSPGAASPSPSGPRLRPLMPPPTWAKSPRASPLPGANGHARPVPQPTTSAAGSQSFPTHKGDGSAVNDNPAVNTWRQDVPHRAGVMAANAPSTSIASHAEPAGTPAQQAGPSRTADGAAGTSSPTIKPTPAAQPSLAGGKDSGKVCPLLALHCAPLPTLTTSWVWRCGSGIRAGVGSGLGGAVIPAWESRLGGGQSLGSIKYAANGEKDEAH